MKIEKVQKIVNDKRKRRESFSLSEKTKSEIKEIISFDKMLDAEERKS